MCSLLHVLVHEHVQQLCQRLLSSPRMVALTRSLPMLHTACLLLCLCCCALTRLEHAVPAMQNCLNGAQKLTAAAGNADRSIGNYFTCLIGASGITVCMMLLPIYHSRLEAGHRSRGDQLELFHACPHVVLYACTGCQWS